MRTLAIDCATEACSAALFDGETLLEGRFETLGRGHAERLVPMISELPDRGRADRILVSLGPGSFTGVRIGLAAARALGLAWGTEVMGYPTLSLVAAMADTKDVTVCMNGGHGEWFVQNFAAGAPQDDVRSLAPDEAVSAALHSIVTGNRAEELAQRMGPDTRTLPALPDARRALLLDPARLTADLRPIYGRGPDAKLPAKARTAP